MTKRQDDGTQKLTALNSFWRSVGSRWRLSRKHLWNAALCAFAVKGAAYVSLSASAFMQSVLVLFALAAWLTCLVHFICALWVWTTGEPSKWAWEV